MSKKSNMLESNVRDLITAIERRRNNITKLERAFEHAAATHRMQLAKQENKLANQTKRLAELQAELQKERGEAA